MDLNNSILEDIRAAVGLNKDSTDFDPDLLMHINASISKLRQNGVVLSVNVEDASATWEDIQDPLKPDRNEYFQLVPLYISMSTKFIFDPPPPSAVEYYYNNIQELLWRLKIAYEEPTTTTTTVPY